MMRKASVATWLLLTGCLLVSSAPAQAGGGAYLRFGQSSYAPGEHAVGRSDHVQTWPGTGEPGEGPFIVYLVPGKGPLWYGHLPDNALRVGKLLIGDDLGEATYPVKAEFDVPNVSDGPYAVWVCARECRLGFGDLVFGLLHVRAATPPKPEPTADPLTTTTGGMSWRALAPIGAVILLVAGGLGLLIGVLDGRLTRQDEEAAESDHA
jgi:hypothetical protein